VWKITSKGIVYICHDATKRYDEPPNQVLAHTTLSKEIFRMVPLDPGAAIATNSFINVSTEAINPGAGCMLAFCENQSSQFWANQIRAYGNHGITTKGCEAITIPNYFGVSTDDLKSLADIAVNNVDSLPQPLPPMQFIFIDGQATFTASHPLNGSGLLVVNGDLNIEGSFTSTFSGYIFATNSVCIKNTNFRGNGCIISNDVVFSPPYNGSNPMPTIRYDQDLIRAVQQNISRFRESSFQRNEFTGFSER
jgi:hypothetical protein